MSMDIADLYLYGLVQTNKIPVALQSQGYPPPGLPLFGGLIPWGPVTNRLVFSEQPADDGTLSVPGQTTSITFRSSHTFAVDTPYIRIAWCNWTPGGGGGPSNAATINAAYDYVPNGAAINTVIPAAMTFGGAASLTVQPKGFAISDPIYGPFKKGDLLLVRSHIAVATLGQKWPSGMALNRGYEGSLAGDQTLSPNFSTSFSGQGQGGWTPCLICGPTLGRLPTVAGIGDSILDGAGDSGYSNNGFMQRALDGVVGYLRVAEPGEKAGSIYSPGGFPCRGVVAANAGNVMIEYGINDVGQGSSLAAIQAAMISLWKNGKAVGQRVFQTTCTPQTSSTDSWATVANQTKSGTSVTSATNASPIVLGLSGPHHYNDGDNVSISGVGGNTAANVTGYAKVTGQDTTHFALYQDAALTNPVAGNGAYTSGGVVSSIAKETIRTAWNSWLRAGAPLNADLTPAAIGAGVMVMGQAAHPLYGVFDVASVVEVNASNVLTQNGGYWLTNGSANYPTTDGTHPSTALHTAMAAKIDTTQFL